MIVEQIYFTQKDGTKDIYIRVTIGKVKISMGVR